MATTLDLRQELLNAGYNQVESVVLEEGTDSTGENALFVWILVDDGLTDEDLQWEKIKSLVDAARCEVTEANPRLYPYVRVRRTSEWNELVGR